jgi:hypothetical protein
MRYAELFETNPVLAVDALARSLVADPRRWAVAEPRLDEPIGRLALQGHGLPKLNLQSWVELGVLGQAAAEKASRPWQPGVLGLVHGEPGGCVVPLSVEPAVSWRIAPQLPVDSRRLTDLLMGLLAEASAIEPGVLPEARAFVVTTPFPWSCVGTSMEVAAALAVLRCAAGAPPALARSCALVEAAGSQLRPVDEIETKLRAFLRECGRGTLLVRHPGCRASAAFVDMFDEVWSVSSLADLARILAPLGVFAAWSTKGPHGLAEADMVLSRLRDLHQAGPDHAAIVQLSRRALKSSWRGDVPPAIRHRPRLDLLRSLRHLGCYAEALQVGELWRQEVRELGEASSLEQVADADLEFAAGLFDTADFERMLEILGPWLHRVELEPLCLSPGLRVRLWNTAARAMVRLPRDGWDALLRRSLDLQHRTDPASVPRTRNYLIEGLLRSGKSDEAEQQIVAADESNPDPTSKAWLAFYRADLARRQGCSWVSPEMEAARPAARLANHPLGLYLQATARQPGRTAEDASERFAKASECFAFDAERGRAANVLWVLVHCMRTAADLQGGRSSSMARASLASATQQPGLELLHSRLGPPPIDMASLGKYFSRLPWT